VQLPVCNEIPPGCGFNRIQGSRTSRAIRLQCRPSGAATPDLATIWNNFRIRKDSTRMVFSKTIEIGRFFLTVARGAINAHIRIRTDARERS
jgi:hypothetical protein